MGDVVDLQGASDSQVVARLRDAQDALVKASCETTAAGWLWYCDVHDTHGNADTKREAEVVASAHQEFKAGQPDWNGCWVNVAEVAPIAGAEPPTDPESQ